MDSITMDSNNTLLTATSGNGKSKKNNFDRRLISVVRRYPFLYDSRHKFFLDTLREEIAWKEIALKLKYDAAICKSRWIELRYKYHNYVYRLRNNFISNQKENDAGHSSMELDSELICLFKFIENPKYFPIPHDIVQAVHEEQQQQQTANTDNDLISAEFIATLKDDNKKCSIEEVFPVTKEMKILVEHIIRYPELYDSSLADYNDHAQKSFVWNVIANEIGAKATKLMKCWILMVTRYEWEVLRSPRKKSRATYQTELKKLMMFFGPCILANPDTVYKQSFYLKTSWYDPIDQLKEVRQLIVQMKKMPQVVHVTDSLLKNSKKNKEYFKIWVDVARMKGSTAGQCEVTWLTMRLFYWELMKMHQHNYQLADKWYFEKPITELYELAKKSELSWPKKSDEPCRHQEAKVNKKGVKHSKKAFGNAAENNRMAIRKAKPAQSKSVPSVGHEHQSSFPRISLAESNLTSFDTMSSMLIRPTDSHTGNMEQTSTTPLQTAVKSLPALNTIKQPLPLVKQIKVSPITVPSAAAGTNSSPPPLVISNARSVMYPTGNANDINAPIITLTSTTANASNLTSISPKSTICLNNLTKVSMATANAASPSSAMTASSPALFSSNEISIDLKDSLHGNYLLIEHPSLVEKYQLDMPRVHMFIREVLAIPQLHNKSHSELGLVNSYWELISSRFEIPVHICRACWNYLNECFYNITPMKLLMKPFSKGRFVWTQSFELFQRFNQYADSNGWLEYIPYLPEAVACIAKYPILYKDVGKNIKEENSDSEAVVWCTISSIFPNINQIRTIWLSLKNVFCQYMSDIELGIDNKWHFHWWRVLAKLKFLIETRYSLNEPYYYIVSNRMIEEISGWAYSNS